MQISCEVMRTGIIFEAFSSTYWTIIMNNIKVKKNFSIRIYYIWNYLIDGQNLRPFPKSTQALLHDTDFKVQSDYIGNFTWEFSPIIFDQNPIFRIYIKVLMGIGLSWTESSSPLLLTTPLRIPTSKKSL